MLEDELITSKSSISIPVCKEILFQQSLDSLYHSRMEPDFDISSWVKQARLHAELSQETLGERLGKTKGNVSAWENGRHDPSFKQVLQIMAITGYKLPLGIGLKATNSAANAAHALDVDELIEVIRGYKQATAAERQAILIVTRRALSRAGVSSSDTSVNQS